MLTALDADILPTLANNPTDLRGLRSRNQTIRHLRQWAIGQQPLLIPLTSYFSNSLERAARQALRMDIDYKLSEDRIGDFRARVQMCLDWAVEFPEVDPGSGDDSSGGSFDDISVKARSSPPTSPLRAWSQWTSPTPTRKMAPTAAQSELSS
ncbi:hypothetical protein PAHAL_3G005000 [Panicum hallii]|jgi:hypothetical protein|uniref:Uncharacterized protein n=1 Tax=Panicum hallii TaxID=206008 RepID=A0A2S3H5A8_9POAL|nr:hypothetical protein PAHAL_3G005000 [Panicum hallii]